jgi:hypothetical protein
MIVAVLLEGGEHIDSISLNAEEVHQIVSGGTLYQIKKTPGTAWLYDSSCNAVYVKVPNDNPDMEIIVNYGVN